MNEAADSRLGAIIGTCCVLVAATLAGGPVSAQAPREFKDVVYATVDGKSLSLDLYVPPTLRPPALVVWVHGGAWTTGTKANIPAPVMKTGFAVASVDFRQSTEARFPAQVHDIKAAIRFLRAKASQFGYQPEKIAVAGLSSGAHLAALVGVTNGNSQLEGVVGDHLDRSSDVQAIVSYFGASNLVTILDQSTPFGLNVRRPALERLLGALPADSSELAKLASPVAHVDSGDPPLLLLHGDQDPQMPINQSHELEGAYEKQRIDVRFRVVHGAGHGGDGFWSEENQKLVVDFLQRSLGR